MRQLGVAFALLTLAAGTSPAKAQAASLTVQVSGVRFSGGSIRVDVCTAQTFLKAVCEFSSSAPATRGETLVAFEDLPPGVYAAQVYHDWNDNHRVDRNALGIPKEGLGFSNDAPLGLHGPSFAHAAFTHDTSPQSLSVRLHHFAPVPRSAEK